MRLFIGMLFVFNCFMIEDVFTMDCKECLNKVEGLCKLQQCINSAQILGNLLAPSGDKNAESKFQTLCRSEMSRIISDNSRKYSLDPRKLLSGKAIRNKKIFKEIVSDIKNEQNKYIEMIMKMIDHNVVDRILPESFCLDQCSEAQRTFVAIIGSQTNSSGHFTPTHDYLIYAAINTLVDEITTENNTKSAEILKKSCTIIPSIFFEGLEIAQTNSPRTL